ncbi:MAG: arylsulfotransferase (ASST) [bacterium]|nr:arylsulfotransferase (ASST) [bacterium]
MKHTTPLVIIFFLIVTTSPVAAQQTVGLFINEEGSFRGYTLFAPLRSTTTYLIDHEGQFVHSWVGMRSPGASVYLLENGVLLRTFAINPSAFPAGGGGGGFEMVEWDGTVAYSYVYASETYHHHHDVEYLPNGNILLIAWELKSSAEAVAAGRNPWLLTDGELWPDHIVEIETTTSTVVWEWHVWDHLVQEFDPTKSNWGVVADHPERVDINYVQGSGPADWNHTNSVDYNEELDQIILSVHNFHEIWVIDHSTTTAEAAGSTGGRSGKGGDLLYRWGNPVAYGAGSPADQQLFGQHNAQWIDSSLPGADNILLFNNGVSRGYSTVDEIIPPTPDANGNYPLVAGSAYGPAAVTWVYMAPNPTDFYSSHISGAGRLPNGNTLICSGRNGTFFEVTPVGEIVWFYVNPVTGGGILSQGDEIPQGPNGYENNVFRAERYGPDFTGLSELTPVFSGRLLGRKLQRAPVVGEIVPYVVSDDPRIGVEHLR